MITYKYLLQVKHSKTCNVEIYIRKTLSEIKNLRFVVLSSYPKALISVLKISDFIITNGSLLNSDEWYELNGD